MGNNFYFLNFLKIILLIILVCNIPLSFALNFPQTKEEFCSRFGTSEEERETIQSLSNDPENLMSFKNGGGLFNGGVCWWHSRFQRNVLYLVIFKPHQTKPQSKSELIKIIHQIRMGNKVVSISGYSNFEEFSLENQELIQRELNEWQVYDGVVLGGWKDGLKGDTTVEAFTLFTMMNKSYDYVAVKKKIAYQKLQIKGITSHAWLIVGIKKVSLGIDLGYIDSNYPHLTKIYSYKYGDKSFYTKQYGNFVPYLEFTKEEDKILQTAKEFCY